MTYTAPRTVGPNDVYPASQWNTEVRDNLNDLHVRLRIASTAPTSPEAGQMWVDTSGAQNVLRVYDGTGWIGIGYDPGGASAGDILKVNSGTDGYEFGRAGMKRTVDTGAYLIPAGPATGTTAASAASSNTFGSWVQMLASAAADLVVIGALFRHPGTPSLTYAQLEIGTGGSGSETARGALKSGGLVSTASAVWYPAALYFPTPIFIESGSRIAARTADSNSSAVSHEITLVVVDAANLEDF